ncbi:exported hypothetical protein [Syntrophobacter sp. SbD1]|nr:exported hypothetical protein [Syntrophobacter sp. SbD1]
MRGPTSPASASASAANHYPLAGAAGLAKGESGAGYQTGDT